MAQPTPFVEVGASGWHAFMATDIERSMDKWRRFGDAMGLALLQHIKIIERSVAASGGVVFKSEGDAIFARFDDVAAAVTAAIDAQRRLNDYAWSSISDEFPDLRVRMAVHCGPVLVQPDDYWGSVVGEVTRLADAASGGQLFLSAAAAEELGALRPRGCRLRDLGVYRLPDFDRPQRISQIVAPGFADIDRLPRSTASANLGGLVQLVDEGAGADEAPEDAAQHLEAVLRGKEAAPELSVSSLRAIASLQAETVREYRLSRIAHRLDPRYGLERHFVARRLQLVETAALLDRSGPEIRGHLELLDRVASPVIVILSDAGGGSSTLLRRLELDLLLQAVRDERPTLVVPVGLVRLDGRTNSPAALERWLAKYWAQRNPRLPTLAELARDHHLVYLLDGLDQVPHGSTAALRQSLAPWRSWLASAVDTHRSARFVIACRAREYVVSLGTDSNPVTHARLLSLDDGAVHSFIERRIPALAVEADHALKDRGPRTLMRNPFYLATWCDQQGGQGRITGSPGQWIEHGATAALRREVQRANPALVSGTLLAERDLAALAQEFVSQGGARFPRHSALGLALERLALSTLESNARTALNKAELSFSRCAELLGPDRAEGVLLAAASLGLMRDDIIAGRASFVDNTLRDFFAGGAIARDARVRLGREVWRAVDCAPPLDEAVAALQPGQKLAMPPGDLRTRAHLYAAGALEDATLFVRQLSQVALSDAADTVAFYDAKVDESLREELGSKLLKRIADPATDLRFRVVAGLALGRLGLPSLTDRSSVHGRYLWPALREIDAGHYVIGCDVESVDPTKETAYTPEHEVDIVALQIAIHPVTRAEWQCFMAAGGYEETRWWQGDADGAWQRGEITAYAQRERDRAWWRKLQAAPRLLVRLYSQGQAPQATFDLWARLQRMPEETFEEYLRNRFPNGALTEPAYWWHEHYRDDARPVVGISWYEARAYCRWLSAASGRLVTLPTEAEWEAAARGRHGRRFPWGDEHDEMRCNCTELRIGQPSPVGIFPSGVTPEGIMDMAGNVQEWTSSAWGESVDQPDFGYPYQRADGREDDGPPSLRRIFRGGNWAQPLDYASAWRRDADPPGLRGSVVGMRVVVRD